MTTRMYNTSFENATKTLADNYYAQVLDFSTETKQITLYKNQRTIALALVIYWKDETRTEQNTLMEYYHDRAEAEKAFRIAVQNELMELH